MTYLTSFFNQEWCRVLLPELQFLSFRFSRVTVPCEAAVIPYLQRQIWTLRSLEVHTFFFSFDQVASIITGHRDGGHQLVALRTLDMDIQCFSPDLLNLLADRIPQFRPLKQTVIVIGPDKQPDPPGRGRVPEASLPSVCPCPRK